MTPGIHPKQVKRMLVWAQEQGRATGPKRCHQRGCHYITSDRHRGQAGRADSKDPDSPATTSHEDAHRREQDSELSEASMEPQCVVSLGTKRLEPRLGFSAAGTHDDLAQSHCDCGVDVSNGRTKMVRSRKKLLKGKKGGKKKHWQSSVTWQEPRLCISTRDRPC